MLVGERRRKPDITQTRLASKEHFPCQSGARLLSNLRTILQFDDTNIRRAN